MTNAFEFQRIKKSKLPEAWQEPGVLEDLERFLQSNWEQRKAFYNDGRESSRQRYIDFDFKNAIKTQEYIGTISYAGEQLNIFPDVFKEDEDDRDASDLSTKELIDNLIVWLEYCDRMSFPFVSMKGEMENTDTFLELLLTVYVHYVKDAVDRQLFFRYEDVRETGSVVKGRIDYKDYITRKYPTGRWNEIDYSYSSFVFDNQLNRIIKYTCRLLSGLTTQERNRRIIHDILMKLGDVSDVNCMPYDCDNIHLNALQQNYNTILGMSKMFLLNKVSTDMLGSTDTICFLFPSDLLFESFIGGYMRSVFADRAKVSLQKSDQYLTELFVDGKFVGNRFLLKEDIVVENDDMVVVLDTKYKEIDRFSKVEGDTRKLGISDADMKQMAVYGIRRGAKRLYLLYPLHRDEEPETTEIVFDVMVDDKDEGKRIPLEILKVPFAFREDPEQTKALLTSILEKAVADVN